MFDIIILWLTGKALIYGYMAGTFDANCQKPSNLLDYFCFIA